MVGVGIIWCDKAGEGGLGINIVVREIVGWVVRFD
jgi:hypothetical protein